jgi:ABC-2 type transport system permease protein
MTRLFRAELLKLSTTRTARGLFAAALALTALLAGATVLTAGVDGNAQLGSAANLHNVVGGSGLASVLALVLGILGMAGEFRHGTVTGTFLTTPDRGRVVAVKLGAYALAGLGIALATALAGLAVALPWLAVKGAHVDLVNLEVGRALVGTLLAGALYGTAGVAIGALFRNQVAAVVVTLAWTQFIENGVLASVLPKVARWLPMGAAAAITSPGWPRLSMWAGALLFAGYAVVLAAAGTRFVVRRDIA